MTVLRKTKNDHGHISFIDYSLFLEAFLSVRAHPAARLAGRPKAGPRGKYACWGAAVVLRTSGSLEREASRVYIAHYGARTPPAASHWSGAGVEADCRSGPPGSDCLGSRTLHSRSTERAVLWLRPRLSDCPVLFPSNL